MPQHSQPPLDNVFEMPTLDRDELTPPASPIAIHVQEAVDKAFDRLGSSLQKWISDAEARICASLSDIGHRLKVYELTQDALEGRIQRAEERIDRQEARDADFERRLSALERERRDTEPAPPPSEAR